MFSLARADNMWRQLWNADLSKGTWFDPIQLPEPTTPSDNHWVTETKLNQLQFRGITDSKNPTLSQSLLWQGPFLLGHAIEKMQLWPGCQVFTGGDTWGRVQMFPERTQVATMQKHHPGSASGSFRGDQGRCLACGRCTGTVVFNGVSTDVDGHRMWNAWIFLDPFDPSTNNHPKLNMMEHDPGVPISWTVRIDQSRRSRQSVSNGTACWPSWPPGGSPMGPPWSQHTHTHTHGCMTGVPPSFTGTGCWHRRFFPLEEVQSS